MCELSPRWSEAQAARFLGCMPRVGLDGTMLCTIRRRSPDHCRLYLEIFGLTPQQAAAGARAVMAAEQVNLDKRVELDAVTKLIQVIKANLAASRAMTELLMDDEVESRAQHERRLQDSARREESRRAKQLKHAQQQAQQRAAREAALEDRLRARRDAGQRRLLETPDDTSDTSDQIAECRMCMEDAVLVTAFHTDGTCCTCVCASCAPLLDTCLRCFKGVVCYS